MLFQGRLTFMVPPGQRALLRFEFPQFISPEIYISIRDKDGNEMANRNNIAPHPEDPFQINPPTANVYRFYWIYTGYNNRLGSPTGFDDCFGWVVTDPAEPNKIGIGIRATDSNPIQAPNDAVVTLEFS